MDQMSTTASSLRSMCEQLSELEQEYKDENQHDEAQQVSAAEEWVRSLMSLPEPGE